MSKPCKPATPEEMEKYQARVLQDFPWLWAIHSDWYLGSPHRELAVRKSVNELLLFQRREPEPNQGVWIYCRNGIAECVLPVKTRGDLLRFTWGEYIHSELPDNQLLMAVVYQLTIPDTGDQKIWINCPPKTNSLAIHNLFLWD